MALDDAQPGVPPKDDFVGLGEGCALCHGRVKHGRSCRTFLDPPVSLTRSAPATVTCSYIVASHGWNLGRGNWYATKMMPGPCLKSVPP